MRVAEEAYSKLFGKENSGYNFSLVYSGRFKGYNAKVSCCRSNVDFKLSRNWKGVSDDIIIGLLQVLMLKLFKKKYEKTENMELYEIFMKKAYLGVTNKRFEPELKESFDRVNEEFFSGLMDPPNLLWGKKSLRKWGCYDFGTDTITLSANLKGETEIMDYVMYHEMLHKKHKFSSSGSRNTYHSKQFKEEVS